MERSLEQRFSDVYISNMDIIGEGLPAGVNDARRGFLENFNILSLPSAGDERYRHCDLRRLFDDRWEYYFTPSDVVDDGADEPQAEGCNISLINGFCRETTLTVLENGIVYGSLRQALAERPELVMAHYNTVADNETEAVTALNSLFMQDGAFVYIPDGAQAAMPLVVDFCYNSSEQAQISFARMLVVAGRGAKADLVINHRSRGGTRFLVNHVRETVIGEGAALNVSEVSRMGGESALVCGNYVRQAADSRADVMNVWLEGGLTRINARTDLEGRGCESNLYGLYLGTNDERIDINVSMNHRVADCNSFELIKGVVSGNAVGAFTGMVYVAGDAQRTVALQQSRNLQLSETAKIYTEPRLEIYADDVKCSHGATVGQMDDEAVYYMRQRGISEEDARKLQLFGFVNDIISHCPVDGVGDHVRGLAERRIEEL